MVSICAENNGFYLFAIFHSGFLPSVHHVTVQYLHSYMRKNPFQISYADGIFAFLPKFSYGQRSKCADLLNSYTII